MILFAMAWLFGILLIVFGFAFCQVCVGIYYAFGEWHILFLLGPVLVFGGIYVLPFSMQFSMA
jgi:hypothetical protein